MRNKLSTRVSHYMPVVLLLLAAATPAASQTIVPLNTGYNHKAFAPYPQVSNQASNIKDAYWINIASYPPTTPSVAPSWVLQTPSAWNPPITDSHWISGRNKADSPPGISAKNPAYTIFRKCFCLLPHFKNASLSFQIRADDNVQAWVNTVLNVALPSSIGNWSFGQPLASVENQPQWFKVGRNCLYVLVEETGGHMGFDLTGTIQADGLAPLPASGTDPDKEFDCPCRTPREPVLTSPRELPTKDEDRAIRDILKIAEERRVQRSRIEEPHQPWAQACIAPIPSRLRLPAWAC